MATTIQATVEQPPSLRSPAEARTLFNRQARLLLNLSSEDFLARWDAGAYRDLPDTPAGRHVGYLALLIPFGRK
jgi:hypothetical protein